MKDASANKLLHILEVIAIEVKTHRHKTSAHRNETTSQSEETLRGFECVERRLGQVESRIESKRASVARITQDEVRAFLRQVRESHRAAGTVTPRFLRGRPRTWFAAGIRRRNRLSDAHD